MDFNRTLEIVLSTILGGGGLAGLIAAFRAHKTRKQGLPSDERQAAQISNVPDWSALNRYWQKEILNKAKEVERVRHALEQQVEHERAENRKRAAADAAHIDALEAHIWLQLPPPPPPRPEDKDK